MFSFWVGNWTNPKPVPDEYDLAIDSQAEKFLDLKQKLTYFLIAASIAPVGFVLTYIKDETTNLAGRWPWLVAGGVLGLLAAGFALLCLHFEINSYRKHIQYRYERKTWDDVPAQEQNRWNKDNRWASSFLKYSFWSLFLEIAILITFLIVLLHAKATVKKANPAAQSVQLLTPLASLPPFVEGSSSEFEFPATATICAIRQTLQDHRSPSAIVIGGSDRRELSQSLSLQSASNSGLAQQRADFVGSLLQAVQLCEAAPVKQVTALIRGPRHTDLKQYKTEADRKNALAEDRRVEVLGLEVKQEAKPALTKTPGASETNPAAD